MIITEIKMQKAREKTESLLAYCSVIFDDSLALHGLRVVQGKERLVLIMPDRKVMRSCPMCSSANGILYRFCCQCGNRLPIVSAPINGRGRPILSHDVGHPVNNDFRIYLENEVISEYKRKFLKPDFLSYDTPVDEWGYAE